MKFANTVASLSIQAEAVEIQRQGEDDHYQESVTVKWRFSVIST